MIRKILAMVAGMLLLVQLAYANEQDDCQANCSNKMQECIARINDPNEIVVQDLKVQCENTRSDCNHFCDDRGVDPYREEKEKAIREQQEQGSGIKTYKFDN